MIPIELKPGSFIHSCEPQEFHIIVGPELFVLWHDEASHASIIFVCDHTGGGGGSPGLRQVPVAVERAYGLCLQNGLTLNGLQIKIFGGADSRRETRTDRSGGLELILAMQAELKKLQLSPHAFDVGGAVGREIRAIADTGTVFMRRLRRREQDRQS